MTTAADKERLVGLHGKLAEVLTDALKATYTDPASGKPAPPPAAILNVARQFLKDNNIDVAAAPAGTPMGNLKDLPIFNDGDGSFHSSH